MASLFFVWTGYSQVADSLHSNRWPAVKGVVLSSELNITTKAHKSDSFYPEIRYSYRVAGKHYEAAKLQYIQDGFGKDWAIAKVAAYPVDATVEVSYHPDQPEKAVLETGGELKWYLFVLSAVLAFCSVFAVLAWFFFKDYRKMVRWGKGLP